MKHARAETIAKLKELLAELRRRANLTEKNTGVFYIRSKPFLHFHDGPEGVFADVKLDHLSYSRYRVNSRREQEVLLTKIDKCLADWPGASRP